MATALPLKEHVEKRFKVKKNGCWEWTGIMLRNLPYIKSSPPVRPNNYSFIEICDLVYGVKLPSVLYSVRTCGNKKCFNPHHFIEKTFKMHLESKINIQPNGCWVSKNKNQTRLRYRKTQITVADIKREYNNVVIKDKRVLSKVCHTIGCFNPDHYVDTTSEAGRKLQIKFRTKVTPKGCWEWTGGKNNAGYGMICKKGGYGMQSVHRAAYEAFIGEIPKNRDVLHTCDVPSCCNPEHLWLGTHNENMKDKQAKKRCSRRKDNPWTQEEMDVVMNDVMTKGVTLEEIADMHGIKLRRLFEWMKKNNVSRGSKRWLRKRKLK